MKNKKITLFLILLVIIICISIGGLVLYFKKNVPITYESVLKSLLNAPSYSTDVTFIVKNARGEFKEEGKIEYNPSETKIILSDKEQIFKSDKILIKYFKDNKEFQVDKDFDNFYKYMFTNEISNYINYENNVNYSWETIDGKEYLVLEYLLLSGNDNFYKQVFYIDSKSKIPVSSIIFDNKENERISIEYKNFIKGKVKKD